MTVTEFSVPASAFLAQFEACGITHVVSVPDYVQISVHMAIERGEAPGLTHVNCATEDEAVAVALGLWMGGKTPILMMQNQGVYASANALRSAGVTTGLPVVILAGQWGRELENLGEDPRQSQRREVRRTEPLLDALEIPWLRVERPEEIDRIGVAFERAQASERPVAVLIGAHTRWNEE